MGYVEAIKFENDTDNYAVQQKPLVFLSYDDALHALLSTHDTKSHGNEHQHYSKKQVEVLDLTGGAIIDFLYDIRKDFPNITMADFVDEVLFPNIYWDKYPEADDDDDSQLPDE